MKTIELKKMQLLFAALCTASALCAHEEAADSVGADASCSYLCGGYDLLGLDIPECFFVSNAVHYRIPGLFVSDKHQ